MSELKKSKFTFGKYKDRTFGEVAELHHPYCLWALGLEKATGKLLDFVEYLKTLPQYCSYSSGKSSSRSSNGKQLADSVEKSGVGEEAGFSGRKRKCGLVTRGSVDVANSNRTKSCNDSMAWKERNYMTPSFGQNSENAAASSSFSSSFSSFPSSSFSSSFSSFSSSFSSFSSSFSFSSFPSSFPSSSSFSSFSSSSFSSFPSSSSFSSFPSSSFSSSFSSSSADFLSTFAYNPPSSSFSCCSEDASSLADSSILHVLLGDASTAINPSNNDVHTSVTTPLGNCNNVKHNNSCNDNLDKKGYSNDDHCSNSYSNPASTHIFNPKLTECQSELDFSNPLSSYEYKPSAAMYLSKTATGRAMPSEWLTEHHDRKTLVSPSKFANSFQSASSSSSASFTFPLPNTLAISKSRIELDHKVALQICSYSSFKVVTKQNNMKFSCKWSSFLPKDLWKALQNIDSMNSQNASASASSLIFSSEKYHLVLKTIQENFACELSEIPSFVLRAFPLFARNTPAVALPRKTANILTGFTSPETLKKRKDIQLHLGNDLKRELKPFQICGVEFGLKRNGRVLIGDEMGLGKTLQALGIAAYYSDEWPLLVVCPSSIRFQWRDQALRWLSHKVEPHEICIVKTGKTEVPYHVKMFIISYDLITKNEKFQQSYKIVICDESHYLKNSNAKRTQVLAPLLRQARRAILLSGTPALNKPIELFQQISCLLPEFCRYEEFANRYCEEQFNRYKNRKEYVGYKHSEELYLFLTNTIMIRRLKKDVQKELPPKLRSRIPIEVSEKDMKEISSKMDELKQFDDFKLDEELRKPKDDDTSDFPAMQKGMSKQIITELFTLTGRAKIRGACDYITYLIQADCKFLVFAHHKEVLDALEEQTIKEKTDYIRIDGSTHSDKRESLVKRFQGDENCKVAILSITACGHGLNLTAANTVVFAELYWVPGQMIQAEDRCHRMGTSHSTVDVHYLIAEGGTLDETVWKTLNKKWNAMTSALNGEEECISVQNLAKGTIPVYNCEHTCSSKPARKLFKEDIENGDNANAKSNKLSSQSSITDFFPVGS